MKFSITELIAKVAGLEAKAEIAFKAELEQIKTTVTSQLTALNAELDSAKALTISLGDEKVVLTGQITELTSKLATATETVNSFNAELSKACVAGNILELKGDDDKPLPPETPPETTTAAALKVPVLEKFRAYQGSLNAAFAKAGLSISSLPGAPAHKGVKIITRAEFSKLNAQTQLDFCKNGGKITN
mgnify:FL=1